MGNPDGKPRSETEIGNRHRHTRVSGNQRRRRSWYLLRLASSSHPLTVGGTAPRMHPHVRESRAHVRLERGLPVGAEVRHRGVAQRPVHHRRHRPQPGRGSRSRDHRRTRRDLPRRRRRAQRAPHADVDGRVLAHGGAAGRVGGPVDLRGADRPHPLPHAPAHELSHLRAQDAARDRAGRPRRVADRSDAAPLRHLREARVPDPIHGDGLCLHQPPARGGGHHLLLRVRRDEDEARADGRRRGRARARRRPAAVRGRAHPRRSKGLRHQGAGPDRRSRRPHVAA